MSADICSTNNRFIEFVAGDFPFVFMRRAVNCLVLIDMCISELKN
jgi:hypothetical protein